MRLLRGFLVLAIVAALWGAPPSVSAAVNELSSPQVTPGTGGVTTTFTFRVRYEGGFRAISVGVTVAGLTIPMSLESGSRTAGWWRGSSLLPIGAWSTVFHASVVQGPAPTLAGPIVVVASVAPSPTSSTPAGPSSGPTPDSAPVDGLDGPTAPPAAPAPSPEQAAATDAAAASPVPAAPDPGPAPGSTGGLAPSDGGGMNAPGPGGAGGSAAGGDGAGTGGGSGDGEPRSEDGAPASTTGPSPATGVDPGLVQPASDTDQAPEDRARTREMVSDLLLIGLAGVASVAIIGTLLLIAGRRREPEGATAVGSPSAADDALLRRIARSARAQTADDPIVAALGVDDEMAARRAVRRAGRRIDDDVRQGKRPKGR